MGIDLIENLADRFPNIWQGNCRITRASKYVATDSRQGWNTQIHVFDHKIEDVANPQHDNIHYINWRLKPAKLIGGRMYVFVVCDAGDRKLYWKLHKEHGGYWSYVICCPESEMRACVRSEEDSFLFRFKSIDWTLNKVHIFCKADDSRPILGSEQYSTRDSHNWRLWLFAPTIENNEQADDRLFGIKTIDF